MITYNRWLQVNKDSPRNMFSSPSFTKEGVERVVSTSNCLVTWHLTIRLNAMLQTVQFPAGISYLNASLANMN